MTLVLMFIAALCLGAAMVVARHGNGRGALPLLVLLVAVGEWNVTYALEIAVDGLAAKVLWAKAQYIGIAAAPVAVFAFSAICSGHGRWLSPARVAALTVIPIATLLLTVTNETHHLVWKSVGPEAETGVPLVLEHGSAFYVNWIYANVLMLVAFILLVGAAFSLPGYFRRQAIAGALAITTPWVGNVFYVLGLTPAGLDLTTIGFAVTALAIMVARVRWGLLDVAPVTRETVIQSMRDGMVVIDADGRITDCNAAARPLLNCSEQEAIGRPAEEAVPALTEFLSRSPGGSPPATSRILRTRDDDGVRDYEAEVVELPASSRLVLLHDVTAREQLQAHLTTQAVTDELTQLPNRRLFLERTRAALIENSRRGRTLAILFIDLNDFKLINDTHGHACGDGVLTAAARRLEQCVRPGDIAARIGGDEFGILLPEVSSKADAVAVANRIAACFREPFQIGAASHPLSASVGIELSGGDGATAESLIASADQAMYEAKRATHSRTPDETAVRDSR